MANMGCILRIGLPSFLAGAAAVSSLGFYFVHEDCMDAHYTLSQQMNELQESVDGLFATLDDKFKKENKELQESVDRRFAALEKFKYVDRRFAALEKFKEQIKATKPPVKEAD